MMTFCGVSDEAFTMTSCRLSDVDCCDDVIGVFDADVAMDGSSSAIPISLINAIKYFSF